MSQNPREDAGSDTSSGRYRAPNFSRPQRQPQPSAFKSGQKNYQDRHVQIVDAFHEPNRDLPQEPRFSDESERTDRTDSVNSASSDFAWNGHSGELDSRNRKKRFDDQRCSVRSPVGRPSMAPRAGSGSTTASEQTFNLGLPDGGAPSSSAIRPGQIMKRVSVDQRSERISTSTGQWEDSASHHTASESGESAGSFDMEGRWQSSDYDTSNLSAAEIRKLEKKGINPALYMEMKEAKKGKKWVPHLLGNGFLN